MQISAFAALDQGASLVPYAFEAPPLAAGECLLKVLYCGICHSDLHMLDNDWRISRYPLIPGHEVVGEVLEVGASVRQLRPGDKVGVGWQRTACLACEDCLEGNENLCDRQRGLIVGGHGGFADHLVVDAAFAFKLPTDLRLEAAGPLLCGGVTVYSALVHAGLSRGQRVGVIGVGGLGHMAVQFAARLGNRVTVFTTSADKAELAHQLGARDAVLTSRDGRPGKLAYKLDILLNTVPFDLPWLDYLNLLGSDGTLSFVGVPKAPLSLPVGALLGKRRRVMGSPIGGRPIMTEMLRVAAFSGVEPLVEHFPLGQINEAVEAVRANRVRYRAVLDVAP